MKQILTLLFVIILSTLASSQTSDYGSATESHVLTSGENRSYTIKVTLPYDFDKKKSYQTLYYLDSWWLSEMVMGTYGVLDLSDKVSDVILVGVSIEGDLKEWNTRRTLDFTPSEYDLNKMGFEMRAGAGDNSIALNAETTGEADLFLAFLEDKAIPFIDESYAIEEGPRSLLGHSYGGLFGCYAMQQKPELFSNFILISPSLWWNKNELLEVSKFAACTEKTDAVKIHLSCGADESGLITRSNAKANELLNGLEKENLACTFEAYENANHNSILSRAIYDGLIFLFGK